MNLANVNPMLPKPFRIVKSMRDTRDVFTMEFDLKGCGGTYPFKPGQFNMLYIFGTGEVPISISGDPGKPDVLKHTTRAAGTVTRALSLLKAGDTIGIRGPYGTHWPVEKYEGYDIILVAGGIGLAPLRPALYHLLANRKKYGHVILLYGARTPQDLLYQRELRQWRSRLDMQVSVTVDTGIRDWGGHVGVVTRLIPRVSFDAVHTAAMVCGPEIMMRFTALELNKHGLEFEDIHVSMERNMKCAVGFCGHCQFGPRFICKDGPVFPYSEVQPYLKIREV